jgi:hypothetical protein
MTNPKPHTLPAPRSPLRSLTTGNWRLETGDWRLETGDWRLETGDC